MRINKYLASAGLASRRKCEEFVLQGRVSVNGEVISSLAFDVSEKDKVFVDGKRVLAAEVLIANSAVRNLLRDGKAEQIMSTMQTNAGIGMVTMNQTLGDLYIQKRISFQEAMLHSADPSGLKGYLTQKTGQTSFK